MENLKKTGKDSAPQDGSFYPADPQKLQSYKDASTALSEFKTPVLIHVNNPNERLFVACMDGTGNDAVADPLHKTNVAKINDQVTALGIAGDKQIHSGYVAGPGTQHGAIASTLDGMSGATYNKRTEEMYKQFIDQSWKWKRDDSYAQIRVADIGFSRGAEQAAGFSRLVQERGIQDPTGAKYTRGSDGMITHVEYSKKPLVPPGEVAQAVGLFDPVGTGNPMKHQDRRLPPSVISGLQINADDERRGLFKSDRIIKPGQSIGGRFLAVNVHGEPAAAVDLESDRSNGRLLFAAAGRRHLVIDALHQGHRGNPAYGRSDEDLPQRRSGHVRKKPALRECGYQGQALRRSPPVRTRDGAIAR